MESLCFAVKHVLQLDLEEKRAVQVAQQTAAYLMGVISAYEYQHYLKANVRFRNLDISAKDFRLMLIEKSYFTLNIKFFAMNMCKAAVTLPNLQRFATAFELVRNDAVLLRRAFEDTKWRKAMRKSERLQSIDKRDIEEGSVERVQSDFNDMYTELMKHIRQKTFSKLRFLVKAENAEFGDFNGELLYKAIKTYYMMVPTYKSEAHVLNYLRTTCTNHALNIIGTKTSNKSRRMVNAGADGFGGQNYALICVSENQAITGVDSEPQAYDAVLNDLNQNDNNRLITELNFERVVAAFGKSRIRKRALLILSGQEDSRFTRYLQMREHIREGEDCTDFVARTKHENVIAHLAAHFGVCQTRLKKFLVRVGTELIKHRSVA